MDIVCRAVRTCVDCIARSGCLWGIFYREESRCISESSQLDDNVLGVVRSGGFCNEPECRDVVFRSIFYIDWSAVGGISFGFSIVFGSLGVAILYWCQRRYGYRAQFRFRNEDEEEDDGHQRVWMPGFAAYNRRRRVREELEEFLRLEGNEEDLQLHREIVREFQLHGPRITPPPNENRLRIPPNVNVLLHPANQAIDPPEAVIVPQDLVPHPAHINQPAGAEAFEMHEFPAHAEIIQPLQNQAPPAAPALAENEQPQENEAIPPAPAAEGNEQQQANEAALPAPAPQDAAAPDEEPAVLEVSSQREIHRRAAKDAAKAKIHKWTQ